MHACYHACMNTNTPQYTLRNVPDTVDRYLRKRAKLSGRSLNQTIIDELSERAGVTNDAHHAAVDSLDWFIGSGIDAAIISAFESEDTIQKQLAAKDLGIS